MTASCGKVGSETVMVSNKIYMIPICGKGVQKMIRKVSMIETSLMMSMIEEKI